MGDSGPTKGSSDSQNTIAPELRGLYQQTGENVQNLQGNIMQQFGGDDGFFQPHIQNIPQMTQTAQGLANLQTARATDPNAMAHPSYTDAEGEALRGMQTFLSGPMGQSPATLAAMKAVRDPALNDLALAGMGNSDAVATSLASAYAPILTNEMNLRASMLPQQAQIGNIAANRQTGLINDAMGSQEQYRNIEEARGKASLADFLRRQGLGSQFTTGILSGFPALSGTSTTSSQSGGGK